MNYNTPTPFDDRVIATYSSRESLSRAKLVLMTKLGLSESCLQTIKPDDQATETKLEGKPKPIGKNMLRIHLWYSAIGLLIGLLIAQLLIEFGPTIASSNPMFTYIAFISPGIFIGVFSAGFRSLKPERDVVNMHAVSAKDKNQWTLVVNSDDTDLSKTEIVEEIKHTDCTEVKG
jgi:hypothetical protein